MSIRDYLEAEPLSELVKFQSGSPQDAIAFIGTVRKHPYEEGKCILVSGVTDGDPAIYEFRIRDIVAVEEQPAPVDEAGKSRLIVRLWIRRGSFGIRYLPFEVEEPLKSPRDSTRLRESFLNSVHAWS